MDDLVDEEVSTMDIHAADDGRAAEIAESRDWRERGASLVEYALLLSLIALVCVAAISFFGSENAGSVTDSADSIVNAG